MTNGGAGMCIRVGIIGAGQIGEDHVRRITEKISGARVTAVAVSYTHLDVYKRQSRMRAFLEKLKQE